MDKAKKIFAGLTAFSLVFGLAACGNSGTADDTVTEETTTTTTGITVEVNTEPLSGLQSIKWTRKTRIFKKIHFGLIGREPVVMGMRSEGIIKTMYILKNTQLQLIKR